MHKKRHECHGHEVIFEILSAPEFNNAKMGNTFHQILYMQQATASVYLLSFDFSLKNTVSIESTSSLRFGAAA